MQKNPQTSRDMTSQLISLALPLILGNILQQFYNVADACIVGRCVGPTAFAAIGVAGSVMNLAIFMINGCCSGISIVFAQLYGKGYFDALRRESFLSVTAGLLFTLALGAAGLLSLNILLALIQTPPSVKECAKAYLRVIYAGLPGTYLYNWCAGALRAAGDSKTALRTLTAAMAVNLALDLIFTAAWNMGISGAALATVISQFFAAAACILYMGKRFPELTFRKKDMRYDGGLLKKTAYLGIISALHQSSLYIGKLLVQGAVNIGGTGAITAYTAATRIEGLANAFGDSGCAAISVLTARNNAENIPRPGRRPPGPGREFTAPEAFHRGLNLMVLLGILLSVLMAAGARPAVLLLAGNMGAAAAKSAVGYLRIISVFYTLCFIGNSFVGLYRGLGRVCIPVAGTVLHISLRVLLSCLLTGRMGLTAVALATGTGWAAVVLFQYMIYKKA